MLEVSKVFVIRHKVLVEGQSIRSVSRQMGVSRNAVRKYVRAADPQPIRRVLKPRSKPVTESVRGRIHELIETWTPRTTLKQRITGTRLHEELVSEGYEVGVTTVRAIFREWKRQRREVFVPLVHRAGDEAQVDFFEVTVDVAGERRKAWKFVMRSMYSGRDFAWVYDRCDQVSFLDGHVRAFEHFGAVPHRCIYDNLSPAVRKVLFPKRELTARFTALANHYLFEPCFARPGTGHDKGGVESRGRGIRLQHLTPIPEAGSLTEICRELLRRLDEQAGRKKDVDGRTVLEKFAEDRRQMLSLPAARFLARKVVTVTASRSSRVRVEGAHYTVRSTWAGLEMTAYVGPSDVEIVCRGEKETYERQRFGGSVTRYRHYLPELSRKPQALRQVAPELIDELGEPFGEFWRLLVDRHGPADAARVLARVLEAICERGEPVVAEVVRRMLRDGETGLLAIPCRQEVPVRVVVPEVLRGFEIEQAEASRYDALLREAGDD